MKVRSGFVSNSSSSSFILFGKEVGIDKIDEENIHLLGWFLCDGQVCFMPDQKIKEYLKEYYKLNYTLNDITLFQGILFAEEELVLSKKELIEKLVNIKDDDILTFKNVEVDYHQPTDLAYFRERFEEI